MKLFVLPTDNALTTNLTPYKTAEGGSDLTQSVPYFERNLFVKVKKLKFSIEKNTTLF